MDCTPSDVKADSPRPFFVPSDVNFDNLPEELRAVIQAVVDPAYRELVLEAEGALERSFGLTIVHLLWLEALDQMELSKDLEGSGHPQRGRQIDRYLRIVGAKGNTSRFLLRLKDFQRSRPTLLSLAELYRTKDQPPVDGR